MILISRSIFLLLDSTKAALHASQNPYSSCWAWCSRSEELVNEACCIKCSKCSSRLEKCNMGTNTFTISEYLTCIKGKYKRLKLFFLFKKDHTENHTVRESCLQNNKTDEWMHEWMDEVKFLQDTCTCISCTIPPLLKRGRKLISLSRFSCPCRGKKKKLWLIQETKFISFFNKTS